ncbi:hypothetical protein RCC89_04725 [Cytophagaceae bacterium ABcell3]|nr:hypothetical protein RCC89_04725 [Cytophagaceae bacterium ABcell3]
MNMLLPRILTIWVVLLMLCSTEVLAQKNPRKARNDSIPRLDTLLDEDEEEEEEKDDSRSAKKKIKKKVFYGIKTKRSFIRKGKGPRQTLEMFYYLKKPLEPDPYIKSLHVFDIKKKKILEVSSLEELDKKNIPYKILHGPYKKLVGGELIEEGIFYVGMKHGRWERYDKEYNLLDKTKYKRGFLKDSKITYYDPAKTKIKEVKPLRYDELHGEYYRFKENGQVLEYGKYLDGHKIGIWIEYFPDKNKKKKETKYPMNPYTDDSEPYVLSEWDEQGNVLIRNGEPFYDPKKGKRAKK